MNARLSLHQLIRNMAIALATGLALTAVAQPLTVSSAASLTDALKALRPQFEASHPGSTVRLNFGASDALLAQIAQGAPVDVFVSADQEAMNRGVVQKLVDAASRKNLASNTLVLIEPQQHGLGLKTLQDLAGPAVKKIAIGKVATVPVGRYTRQALDSARLWAALQPKFVQADNTRQVLDYVSRAEVEAGFVYRTDAAQMPNKVRVVQTVVGHTPISYPVAVVADSRQKALAQEFITFLMSDAAQQVLARHGFGKP
jgi:molybdate transport system substrate-binding protein